MRSAGDGTTRSRGRGLRAQFEGLSRLQVVLAVLPLGLVPIGGAIGGGFGGLASVANLAVARRQASAATKAVSMICICVVAYGAFFVVSGGIRRALTSAQTSRTPIVRPIPIRTNMTQPVGDAGWQSAQARQKPGVVVNPPTVIHATGAELSWPTYVNATGKAANDLASYEVYRDRTESFTPSATTLLASVDAHSTTFVDSTATAVSNPLGNDYWYMVAVRTRSGALIAGPTRLVQLPPAGQTEIVVPARAATTLSSARPRAVVDTFTIGGSSQPWLEAGRDTDGYGVTRAVFDFGSLNAIPARPIIVDARLSLWSGTAGDTWSYGPYTLHALRRSFSGAQATWDSAATGTAWERPGGDFSAPGGLGLPAAGDQPLRRDFDATAIVRRWLRSPGSDHGLLLKAADEAPSSQERAFFAGMNADDPAQRPALVITLSDS